MLLETSFCGVKSQEGDQQTREYQGTKIDPEEMEKVILSRKHDPTKAILAEGISVESKVTGAFGGSLGGSLKSRTVPEKPARRIEKSVQSVKSDITITVDKPQVSANSTPKLPKTIISASGVEYTYIPLKGELFRNLRDWERGLLWEVGFASGKIHLGRLISLVLFF